MLNMTGTDMEELSWPRAAVKIAEIAAAEYHRTMPTPWESTVYTIGGALAVLAVIIAAIGAVFAIIKWTSN